MTHARKLTLGSALVSAAMLAFAANAYAQTPPAFGHWEGMLSSPIGSTTIHFDIGADSAGATIAALTLPDENISGLPLGNVKIEGGSIGFDMPIASEGSFHAAIAADGKSFAGLLDKGVGSADFSVTRTGDARFPAPPKNPTIDARYEGEYSGGLHGDGGPVLHVRLANKPDGAVGHIVVDGGAAIPLTISQSGDKLDLTIMSAGEAITVQLDGAGDLVGTFSGNSGSLPVKLQRVRKG